MKNIINAINNLEDETEKDKEQIKKALKCCKYILYDNNIEKGKVSRKKAIEILGVNDFVSGLERASFHWTAARTKDNKTVLFDNSKMFEVD